MILLFQKENCPYCAKVRNALTQLGISYVTVNSVKGTPARALQVKWGGQDQVPFLVDIEKGITMYESDDIVQYLTQTYGQ